MSGLLLVALEPAKSTWAFKCRTCRFEIRGRLLDLCEAAVSHFQLTVRHVGELFVVGNDHEGLLVGIAQVEEQVVDVSEEKNLGQ